MTTEAKTVRWSAILEDVDMGELEFDHLYGDLDAEPEMSTHSTELKACVEAFLEGCEYNYVGCTCRNHTNPQCAINNYRLITEEDENGLQDYEINDLESTRAMNYLMDLDRSNKLTKKVLDDLLTHCERDLQLTFTTQKHE